MSQWRLAMYILPLVLPSGGAAQVTPAQPGRSTLDAAPSVGVQNCESMKEWSQYKIEKYVSKRKKEDQACESETLPPQSAVMRGFGSGITLRQSFGTTLSPASMHTLKAADEGDDCDAAPLGTTKLHSRQRSVAD